VLMCSSLSSLAGGVGQVDYCGANAFLDALAYRLSASGATRAVSVDWDTWREVGMAVNTPIPAAMESQRASATAHGILPREGAAAFEHALGIGAPRVIVSTRDLDRVLAPDRLVPASRPVEVNVVVAVPDHERPALETDYVAPRTEVETRIAVVWQQLLGIDRVGIHDNFFDLGGHSLVAIQVVSRLRDDFSVDLSVEGLFDSPTVAGVAGLVEQLRHEAPQDSEQVAELLDLVEGLSDEEVKSLLESHAARLQERT
jgi:acyl carrier protein